MVTRKQVSANNWAHSEIGSLLPIREVCQLLNVHANTVRRWSAQGLLHEFRVGPAGHRRFRLEDVNALLNEK
ncbi:MAG: helix-turn-helix domain-containing protein [Dehalococcoidia bacterium]|nr:MAG: helix-turn-helix domain-containing protein [Dehalococcoidia bacterium]